MSSLLALQTKDTIVFASDTALSATVKDKTYRVGNNETKLFEYEYFIMFASGKKYLRDLFIDKLSTSPTVDEIQDVLNSHIIQMSEEYSLEIVIAMKDLSKTIFLSSTDGFKYSENLPNEYTNLFTAGYKTNEVADNFEKYYQQFPLLQSLNHTYKDLACSEIGGHLDVIILEKNNIRKYQFCIDEMKIYSDEELIKISQLVHANRLVGRLILSNKLWVEDEQGIVSIQSGIATFYDENGDPRVYIGKYPSYENPNVYKVGIRADGGSFELRTSSTSNSGMLIDGTGISAYNNNSVRTFRVDAVTGKVSIVGSLDIRSSPDANKGVVIDDAGITIYGTSGQIVFRADHYGNVVFKGRLDGATGTVTNLGGTVQNISGSVTKLTGDLEGMDGTFKGKLVAAEGEFAGTLTAESMKTLKLDADQITTGKIKADLIDATSLTAASITADQISGGMINGDAVSVSGRMNIYGGLKLHSGTLYSGIYFDGNHIIERTDGILAFGSHLSFGTFVEFHGQVDFSNANVTGLPI